MAAVPSPSQIHHRKECLITHTWKKGAIYDSKPGFSYFVGIPGEVSSKVTIGDACSFLGTALVVAELTLLWKQTLVSCQAPRPECVPPGVQCLSICRLLNTSHSDWCDVIPQCGFDLHSLLLVMLSIFSCGLLAICMSSLGKCLSRSPAGRYPRSWRRQWQATQVFLPGQWRIGWS